MTELTPLARRFREARNDAGLSNRKIAEAVGLSPPTVDRLMNGDGQAKVDNIDLVAEHLGIPIAEARELAGLPRTWGGQYFGPRESRLLDDRQRAAIDEMIRSIVAQPIDELQQIEELLRGLADEDLHQVAVLAAELADEREQAALSVIADYAAKEGISTSEYMRRMDDPDSAWVTVVNPTDSPLVDVTFPSVSALTQSDVDLAGGDRTAPGESEGRQRREHQDRDAERGDHP